MFVFAFKTDWTPLIIFCGGIFLVIFISLLLFPAIRRLVKLKTKRAVLNWQQMANQLGLRIEQTDQNTLHPMKGLYQGREVEVGVAHLRSSEGGGSSYTYCQTKIDPQLRLMLKLDSIRGLFNDAIDAVTGIENASVGNPEFDRRFSLLCHDNRVQQLLLQNLDSSRNLAQDLLQAKQTVPKILLTDELFYVSEDSIIDDFNRLQELLKWTVYLAHQVEKSNRLLPLSDWEKTLIQAWKAFAERNAIAFDERNLSLKGSYQGFGMQVNLGRSEKRTWLTEFNLDFGGNLMTGLKILQQNAIHEVVSFFGGQDLQVGEAAFDKAFVVKAKNVQAVQSLLKPDLCGQLLKLNSPAKNFKVDDEGIFLSTETLVCEEQILQSYFNEIALAARLILR